MKLKMKTPRALKTFWEDLKAPKTSFFYITMILVLAMIIGGVLFFQLKPAPPIERPSYRFSQSQRTEELQQSYNYFINIATDHEKLIRWIELYYKKPYSLSRTWGSWDCSSAAVNFYRSFGAEMEDENTQSLRARILKLQELNLVPIRKNLREVQRWDIIIFKPVGGNYHTAVVYDITKSGQLCYADMNAVVDTMGLSYIAWGSHRIDCVVGMSFSLWIGDLKKIFYNNNDNKNK